MSRGRRRTWCTVAGALSCLPPIAAAQRAACGDARPQLVAAGLALTGQYLLPLHSPYAGPNSLRADGDRELTARYDVGFGSCLPAGLQAYVDVEMARGAAVSGARGLGGYVNADALRLGVPGERRGPYVARAFVRWVTGGGARTWLDRAADQVPGEFPARRLEVQAGRFAANDVFDANRYAGAGQGTFLNWALTDDPAWDFAGDARRYSWGATAAWITPRWTVRLGSFLMPVRARSRTLDTAWPRAAGDNLELTLRPGARGTVLRLLGYVNRGRMGDYRAAVAAAQSAGGAPDVAADARSGRRKYGFGLNLEQPIADAGATGVFARAGWNDGATESVAFTEADRHLSVGAQLAGTHWGRPADRVGIGLARQGLAAPHREYLAAGGAGMVLGDGALEYGSETVVEGCYVLRAGAFLTVSADLQGVWNPGYNRARGPAAAAGLGVMLRY